MYIFLSCDWGTSAFRLRLVNTTDLKIVTEVTSEKGIASTYYLWQRKGSDSSAERLAFYQQLLSEGITDLQSKHPVSLNHIPVFISGMASSSIGILNLTYGELPFSTDGSEI